jgi:hypothetical protein
MGPITKSMMPCTQANPLLPLEIFLFTMLLEEHKEIRRIRRIVDELVGEKETVPLPSATGG